MVIYEVCTFSVWNFHSAYRMALTSWILLVVLMDSIGYIQ